MWIIVTKDNLYAPKSDIHYVAMLILLIYRELGTAKQQNMHFINYKVSNTCTVRIRSTNTVREHGLFI